MVNGGMRHPRSPIRKVAFLHIALALLVQFSPSIHAAAPHEHDSSGCKHGSTSIHFEAAKNHSNDAPCLLCAHLLGRQAHLPSVGLRLDVALTVQSNTPPLEVTPGNRILQLPNPRGPPSSL